MLKIGKAITSSWSINHNITVGCTPLILECSNNLSYWEKSLKEKIFPLRLFNSAYIRVGYLYIIQSQGL